MSTDLNKKSARRSSRVAKFEHDFDKVRSATKRLAANTVDSAREAATDLLHEGKAKASGVATTAQNMLQERPLRTLVAAVGIGFALGFLARRR
jgi:ElaB/YqjD/DUF883 family membrane-anchored ribosome-binding protein